MSSFEKALRIVFAGILLVGFAELARSQETEGTPEKEPIVASETVPTLYVDLVPDAVRV